MDKYRILFQGDSITDCGRSREEGLRPGTGLGEGYPSLVAARLLCDRPEVEWDIINRGISGNRVVDLYARWKIDALNLRPDLISIMIGINDTWHEKANGNGVEVPRYARIYRELLEWTAAALPKARLMLMEPYVHCFGAAGEDWKEEIDSRREVVRQLARDFGAVFLPTQELMDDALGRAPADHWTFDGVHPTPAGHQLIADAWLKASGLL